MRSIEHITAGLSPWLEYWRGLMRKPLNAEARVTIQERINLFESVITALREKKTYKQGYSDGWSGHWQAVSNAKMQLWEWGEHGPTDKNFDPNEASRLPDEQIGYLIAAAIRDADVLRDAIEEAPHDIDTCERRTYEGYDPTKVCTCWKSRLPESHVRTLTGDN